MCVIIYCPKGVEIPSLNELRAAYDRNPNGCGFVTKSRHYHSLHFGAFYRQLKKRDINQDCIIHFRFATQGSIKVKNCHPFYNKGYWFAHNGVLPIMPNKDKTDSQLYFNNEIRPLITKYGWRSDEVRCELIMTANRYHSRFALMHKGETLLFGDFKKYKDRYYSNFNHLYLRCV